MGKIKMIVGKNSSGKSTYANAMCAKYNQEEKHILNGDSTCNPFMFSECNFLTKVIIIDDLKNNKQFIPFLFFLISGVNVNKRGQLPFTIFPEIIIVCDESITKEALEKYGSSLNRRIEIIEFPQCTEITEEEIQLELLGFAEHTIKEQITEICGLNIRIMGHQDYETHLLGMLEWIKENFGDVDTSDFGNKNLAEYIDDCLEMEKDLAEKCNQIISI